MGPDDSARQALQKLLSQFASARGPFQFKEEKLEHGSSFRISPQITTFSDHIVISYRIGNDSSEKEDRVIVTALGSATKLIAWLADEAMKQGFLIRGGATLGPLVHDNDIVLGEAMVEAYDLESRVAIYPRIAVSSRLYTRVDSRWSISFFRKDSDGITHFNYFRYMLLREQDLEVLRRWVREVLSKCVENIAKFEAKREWNKLSKWAWFTKVFEREVQDLHLLDGGQPQLRPF